MTSIQVIQKMLPGKSISVNLGMVNEFNPVSNTITLTPAVVTKLTTEAIATVAHECAHATQNLKAWISFINIMKYVVIGLILFLGTAMFLFQSIYYVKVAVFMNVAVFVFYKIIRIALEYDASRKAYAWMKANNFNRKICFIIYRNALFTYLNPLT